ncbi:glycerate dehydrogenase [Aulographum hederae CBS 113979]|uniref:Glycerate dehydrogenase n=1 Tax=Aulographum hederae CBS 113979 TaxID=1176131 RepID=A0A6G1GKH6_9PEZI|nr:glycerate dehydrogenase [Aulographum hederae CBS 113979]
MSSHPTQTPTPVAILDDYLSTSTPHFSHIRSSQAAITTITEPLPTDISSLTARLHPYHVISTLRERTPFPSTLLRSLPNLKLLLCTGTQFQTFDLVAAKDLGIVVAASPGRGRTDRPPPTGILAGDIRKGGAHPTTQHTWAMILALAHGIHPSANSIASGGWQAGLATGLLGKTLGIVGLGRLGAAVARVGVLAWGMKVICWSASLDQEKADAMARQVGLPVDATEQQGGEKTFKVVSKEEVFREADAVSLHYVLSERSKGVVGKEELESMKPTSFFINSSRGPLVDEEALLEILNAGRLKGAALDVFDIEPLPLDSRWRTTKWGQDGRSQVLLTPHMGYVEEHTLNSWYAEQAENLERWLEGKDILHRIA